VSTRCLAASPISAATTFDTVAPMSANPLDHTLPPGALFANRYRVVRAIARGGMGAVFEAEQVDVGLRVALKVMLPHAASSEKLRAYFEREAQVSARIESDHVVQVYAAGVEPSTGEAWMAMEYLDGETLEDRVKRAPLGAHEAATIFQQLGHALAAAHRAGIVHCDLKPANVFLARSRREGAPITVKALDFGIARVLRESGTSAIGTTVAGSPRFMAPEQTKKNARIKPGTDLWALGLMAFHALTGADYWRNTRDLMALLGEIHHAELVAPSVRARELGVGARIPAGFDAWFAACVVRDLDARLQDAAAATARLAAVLAPPTPRAVVGTVALSDETAALHAAMAAFADAERRGDRDAALELCERVLAGSPVRAAVAPRAASLYVARAAERERAGDLTASRADADHAVQLTPHDGAAWYQRSRTLRLLGDTRAGVDDLHRAAQLGVAAALREVAALRG
jgi:serine/threonine-protein kinase